MSLSISGTAADDYYITLQTDQHYQVAHAPDLENQRGIQYIQPRTRSIIFLEAPQAPEYDNQQGIEYIHPRTRSIIFLGAPQAPEYDNQQGIEYIQPSTRSINFLGAPQAPEYDNQQGIEYIQPRTRSINFLGAPQAPPIYENKQGIEYIQLPTRSMEEIPAPRYENQQGIEYIQSKTKSVFPEGMQAPKYVNQGIEYIKWGIRSAKAFVTLQDNKEQATEFVSEEEIENQVDRWLSIILDILEEFDEEKVYDNRRKPITWAKEYRFVNQYGFHKIDSQLKKVADKAKEQNERKNWEDAGTRMRSLLTEAIIERKRMTIVYGYVNRHGLAEHIQARIRSEVLQLNT